ncbi:MULTISPECIES: hypothetical protein [unclassified Cyanobium]|uniref:hypothetical protein n=1 Tax=unclassified Cyanobium TaxID=2627006 RepID=UPI0020CDB2F1|nr:MULTISPECIES: hypothetical protein [unclassified Cyanobium]MCP9835110.1 hypothetical protein [Cyanobium sp. La Preciosa 7G6]MCP9937873.1 hypothetical protein [Cyanobium sp. Aljojuca 7A6]
MTTALVLHQGAESSLDYFLHAAFRERHWRALLVDTRRRPPSDMGSQLMKARVVVLVRYWPSGWCWRAVLRQARRQGLRCIYWMDDDLMDRSGFEVLPRKYAAKLRRLAWDRRHAILDWCQELWVSTPSLAQRYASLNPELIPLRPQARVVEQIRSFTIGYHGTASHRQELLWLYPLIADVQARYSHTLVELYGDDKVRKLYSPLPRVQVQHPVPWERYREVTAGQHLDLLLCPLLDNTFNGARAAVKFFDAVRLGAVGLYSNRAPYANMVHHGDDGLLLGDQYDEWLDAIHRLSSQPQWREQLADSARCHASHYLHLGLSDET